MKVNYLSFLEILTTESEESCVNGLVQGCSIFIAIELEILQSCTLQSVCRYRCFVYLLWSSLLMAVGQNSTSVYRLTVYPKKYAHGFVVLCFVVVMQSFIMNSHEVFIHIHQGCFAGTGAIVRLPRCQ